MRDGDVWRSGEAEEGEGMSSYSQKLLDPRWQRRRLEILDAAGWRCTYCGATDKTFHVHHRRYIRGHQPWEYEDADLAALCKDCHSNHHDDRARLDAVIARAGEYGILSLTALCAGYLAGLPVTTYACDELYEQAGAFDPDLFALAATLRALQCSTTELEWSDERRAVIGEFVRATQALLALEKTDHDICGGLSEAMRR